MVKNFHNGKEVADLSKVVVREKDAPQLYQLIAEIERSRNEKADEKNG